jgi:hypothetical protein
MNGGLVVIPETQLLLVQCTTLHFIIFIEIYGNTRLDKIT